MNLPKPLALGVLLERILSAGLALIALIGMGAAVPAQDPSTSQDWQHWTGAEVSREAVSGALAKAEAELAKRDGAAEAGSPETLLRDALSARVGLLNELRTALERGEGRRRQLDGAPDELAELEHRRASFDELEPPAVPEEPTTEGLATLEKLLAQSQSAHDANQQVLTEASAREDSYDQLRTAAAERGASAKEMAADLEESVAATPGNELLELKRANALLEARLAAELQEQLLDERKADSELFELRSSNLDLAILELSRLNEERRLYGEALIPALDAEIPALDANLAELERVAADPSQEPHNRFLAEAGAASVRIQKNIAELAPVGVRVGQALSEQQQSSVGDELEFEILRDQIKRRGSSGAVADKIQATFLRLDQRRAVIESSIPPDLLGTLDAYGERSFEIDEQLYGLRDQWLGDLRAAGTDLEEDERREFETRARGLREEYRRLLRSERTALIDLLVRGEELSRLIDERLAELSGLEDFLRAQVFWIRDEEPISGATFVAVADDLRRLGDWRALLLAPETTGQIDELVTGADPLSRLVLFFLIVPAALLLLRRWLRRVLDSWRPAESGTSRKSLKTFVNAGAAILDSALLPTYLLLLANTEGGLRLPSEIDAILRTALRHLAVCALVLSVSRTLLGPPQVAHKAFGLPLESARAILRPLRFGILAYLLLLIPAAILQTEPLALRAIPRLGMNAFLWIAAVCVFQLFRPSSHLSRALYGKAPVGERWRPLWSGSLALACIAMPILHTAGYLYATYYIWLSLLPTIVTLLVLPLAYRLTVRLLEGLRTAGTRVRLGRDPAAEERDRHGADLRTFVRLAFALIFALLLMNYWGLDEKAWRIFEDLKLYTVEGDGPGGQEWVTMADALSAVGILLVTGVALRNLPGVYELAIFPRMRLDAGLRYAVVTISRYTLFFGGLVLFLTALKLDLDKMAWLVAAMGVGLGFGLQEIVSNFVCGIILLVERPIRVGDLVTVANVSGRVLRINIRATTVMNFDRLEVIVPNRDLITQQVTNWTLGDSLTRLVVPIRVAHGSDIARVKELLLAIVRAQPEVLKDPEPEVLFLSHGEFSLDFEIRAFVAHTRERMMMLDRINTLINRELEVHGIVIPLPQRVVHLRPEEAGAEGPEDSEGTARPPQVDES